MYPQKPKLGIRASKANEIWHIDTSIIRLIDGSRMYLHAAIDNFSRKILGWSVSAQFEAISTDLILLQAIKQISSSKKPPNLIADGEL